MNNQIALIMFISGMFAGLVVAIIVFRGFGGDGGMGRFILPKQPTPPNRVFVN